MRLHFLRSGKISRFSAFSSIFCVIFHFQHNGKLFVDDYILRVGSDFFHWMLWWAVMPMEQLSHYVAVHYNTEPFQFHSTLFTEEVIWSFHIWSFVLIICAVGIPIAYWYKYKFRKNTKRRRLRRSGKDHDDSKDGHEDHDDKIKEMTRRTPFNHILNNNHPITQAINKGLVRLEIMVHDTHSGNRSSLPLSSLLKRKDF